MDDQTNVYSEKKLANFETTYKETILSKPQDINVTITGAHLYGLAFICEQKGTKESDPEYTRFVCGYEEITKIYINNNNRNSPIYVQCDDTSKGVMNRRRIILPCFANNEEIIKIIESAKADFDKKNVGKQKPPVKTDAEKAQERERLKKAADEEFENLTSGYKKPENKPQKAAPKSSDDFTVADILGLDNITVPAAESAAAKPEPPQEVKSEPVKEKASDDFFEELVIPDVADLPDAQTVEDPGDMPDESFAEIKLESVDIEKITEPEIVSETKSEPEVKEEPPVVHETVHKSEFSSGGMYAKSMYAAADKEEAKPEPEKKPAPAPAPAPKPEKKAEPVKPDVPQGKMSLEEFQTAVKKLKAMRDENVLTEEEFAAEKSKLLQFLY